MKIFTDTVRVKQQALMSRIRPQTINEKKTHTTKTEEHTNKPYKHFVYFDSSCASTFYICINININRRKRFSFSICFSIYHRSCFELFTLLLTFLFAELHCENGKSFLLFSVDIAIL